MPTSNWSRWSVVVGVDEDHVLVDVSVGDDHGFTVEGRDPGLADVDLGHGPGLVDDVDLVTGAERLPEQQQHAGQGVLEDVLEREPDRDREEPETGEQVDRLDRRERDRDGEQHADDHDDPRASAC